MLKSLEYRLHNNKLYLSSELMDQQNLFSKELLEYLKSLIYLEISVVKDNNLSANNLLFLSKIEFYKDIVFHNLKGRTLILLDNEFKEELNPLDITLSETAKAAYSIFLKDYEVFSCHETPERFEVNLYDFKKDLEKEEDRSVEPIPLEERNLKYHATKRIMEDFGLKEENFSKTPSMKITGNDEYITVPTIVDKGPNLRIIRNTKHY